jgi:hypothetical protein
MVPITHDAVDVCLTWGDHQDAGELLGRWVALDIRLQQAEVFAVHNRGVGEAAPARTGGRGSNE